MAAPPSLQHTIASALDPITVVAPAGTNAPPPDERHVIDMHLAPPAEETCRLDGRTRRSVQVPGRFTVVPAGAVGSWAMSKKIQALLLRLSPALVHDTAEAMGLGRVQLVPSIHAHDPAIERLGALVRWERDEGYPSGRLYLDSLASALAARLLAEQTSRGHPLAARRGLPGHRLRDVVEYIEEHLEEDLGLEELAAVAGFSPSHFKVLFKQSMRSPVHRYVVERRVDRARALVLEGEHSLTEIALQSGFAHQSHMARCMRQVLGVNPGQIARSSARARSRPARLR